MSMKILQDIQGPKIRVGTFPDSAITLVPGDEVSLLSGEDEAARGEIFIKYLDRVSNLGPGDVIQLLDGRISLEVTSAQT